MSKGSNAGRVQVRKYHAFGGHREGITEVAGAQTPTELKTENIPPGVKYVASTGKALLSLLKLKHLQSSSPKIPLKESSMFSHSSEALLSLPYLKRGVELSGAQS